MVRHTNACPTHGALLPPCYPTPLQKHQPHSDRPIPPESSFLGASFRHLLLNCSPKRNPTSTCDRLARQPSLPPTPTTTNTTQPIVSFLNPPSAARHVHRSTHFSYLATLTRIASKSLAWYSFWIRPFHHGEYRCPHR